MVAKHRPNKSKPVDLSGKPLTALERLQKMCSEMLAPRPEQEDNATGNAERKLYQFVKQAWSVVEPVYGFVEGWHIGCICEHLTAVTELEIDKLVINIPPRHGKSLIAAVFWFCWVWIRDPGARWIYTSYAAHLSERDSVRCRNLITSPWYQNRWGHLFNIKDDENTKVKFTNSREGYRIATSIRGVGTGEGGDYIVADDPHKVDEGRSEAKVREVLQNWDETLSSRWNNPNRFRRVIIMQRVNERDLSGHTLASDRGYQHLCLPAEYEPRRYWLPEWAPAISKPRDAIIPTKVQIRDQRLIDGPGGSGREQEGDLLWPQHIGQEALGNLKAELQAYGTAAQLQHRPAPQEGTIFKQYHFRYFTQRITKEGFQFTLGVPTESQPLPLTYLARECRWFQVCDTALTLRSTSAWTCAGTFCITPGRHLLVYDIWRERIEVPKQFNALIDLRTGRGFWDRQRANWAVPCGNHPWPVSLMFQAIENKASGIGLIQQGAAEGKPFKVMAAIVDKVQRSGPVSTMFENGMVYFLESARGQWLTDYEDELLTFPTGAFSDQVDVTSYAGMIATQQQYTANVSSQPLVCSGGETGRNDTVGTDLAGRLGIKSAGAETYFVNGHEITFDDEQDTWWQR